MQSLKQSSQAMKNAGLGTGAVEAESVMNELDGQLREAEELTTVLATPLQDDDCTIDVDAELELIAEESCIVPGCASSMNEQSSDPLTKSISETTTYCSEQPSYVQPTRSSATTTSVQGKTANTPRGRDRFLTVQEENKTSATHEQLRTATTHEQRKTATTREQREPCFTHEEPIKNTVHRKSPLTLTGDNTRNDNVPILEEAEW